MPGRCLYGQSPPLVNASRRRETWQNPGYRLEFPALGTGSKLLKKANVTVIHNGWSCSQKGLEGNISHQSNGSYDRPHAPEVYSELQITGILCGSVISGSAGWAPRRAHPPGRLTHSAARGLTRDSRNGMRFHDLRKCILARSDPAIRGNWPSSCWEKRRRPGLLSARHRVHRVPWRLDQWKLMALREVPP